MSVRDFATLVAPQARGRGSAGAEPPAEPRGAAAAFAANEAAAAEPAAARTAVDLANLPPIDPSRAATDIPAFPRPGVPAELPGRRFVALGDRPGDP